MVIFIPNVPCKYQHLIESQRHQFILLHKLIDNEEYRNHYLKLSEKKDKLNTKYYFILDNSAYEMGESMNAELLLEWAEKLNVDEIIIPDVYKNMNKTLEYFYKYSKDERFLKYKLMGVPQGSNEQEYTFCLMSMLAEDKVKVIGLNKIKKRDLSLIKTMKQIERIPIYKNKEFHMLGTNNLFEWGLMREIPEIRSADSRVLAKMITGVDDIWEEELNKTQLKNLKNLINEVKKWEN